MTRSAAALSLLSVLGLSTAAGATDLQARQAGPFAFDGYNVSVFYTDGDDGAYKVVTTVAPETNGAPIRFVTTLAAGQSQTLAVGRFGTGTPPATLEMVRDGDALAVNPVPNGEAGKPGS